MRIIDADALLEQVQYRKSIDGTTDQIVADCVNLTRKIIYNMPTLSYKDLVPQGEWLWFGKRGIYGDMYACSECHAKYDGQSPFCPNCGARMK